LSNGLGNFCWRVNCNPNIHHTKEYVRIILADLSFLVGEGSLGRYDRFGESDVDNFGFWSQFPTESISKTLDV